jgi:hypothetical protein
VRVAAAQWEGHQACDGLETARPRRKAERRPALREWEKWHELVGQVVADGRAAVAEMPVMPEPGGGLSRHKPLHVVLGRIPALISPRALAPTHRADVEPVAAGPQGAPR